MTQATEKSRFGTIDILLTLGCLGVIEMIVVIIFWEQIIRSRALKLLHPDQPLEVLAVLAVVAGLIGLFNYAFGLFTETKDKRVLRNYLAGVFIVGLAIVGILHFVY